MRIDWSGVTISNHQRMTLLELIEAIPADPSFDHVLPLDGGCRAIRISRHGAGPDFDAHAAADYACDPRNFCAVDYESAQTIGLDYHYRNAGGAEISGHCLFRGRMDLNEHATLLTALAGAEMGSFIPSQVGLDDLQQSAEWELDFEGHDHVWHGFERIIRMDERMAPSSTRGAQDLPRIESLIDACRVQITRPWDDDLAMRQHLGAV